MFANLYFVRLSLTLLYISELIFICRFNGPFRTSLHLYGHKKTIWQFSFHLRPPPFLHVLLNTILPSIGGAPFHLYDPKQPLQGMSPYILMTQCAFFLFVSLLMYIQGVKRDRKNIKRLQKSGVEKRFKYNKTLPIGN